MTSYLYVRFIRTWGHLQEIMIVLLLHFLKPFVQVKKCDGCFHSPATSQIFHKVIGKECYFDISNPIKIPVLTHSSQKGCHTHVCELPGNVGECAGKF